jgi:Type II secretion system (T2SS), protein M subtype b
VKINAREKRFLIVGAGIAGIVLLTWGGLTFLPSREGLARELEDSKTMLLRQREMIGREEAYKARGDQYRQRLAKVATRLLPGDNPNVAGAELQKILKEIADSNGVEISRRDIRPQQKSQNNLLKISVNMDTNCTPEQLVRLLTTIENYEKTLTVEELSVMAFRSPKRYEIRPTLTVTGYIAAPENQAGEKAGKQP